MRWRMGATETTKPWLRSANEPHTHTHTHAWLCRCAQCVPTPREQATHKPATAAQHHTTNKAQTALHGAQRTLVAWPEFLPHQARHSQQQQQGRLSARVCRQEQQQL